MKTLFDNMHGLDTTAASPLVEKLTEHLSPTCITHCKHNDNFCYIYNTLSEHMNMSTAAPVVAPLPEKKTAGY